jgi:hypothetical protein
MKKPLFTFVALILLSSCSVNKPLYTWAKYDVASYNYLKNSDEESTEKLLTNYQLIIDKQKGSRKAVPPGVYADYGFILLQNNKVAEGKLMLQKEIELYPESKIFMDRILNMLE